MLSNLLKRSPPQSVVPDAPIKSVEAQHTEPKRPRPDSSHIEPGRQPEYLEVVVTEETPLLSRATSEDAYDNAAEIEGQKPSPGKRWFRSIVERGHKIEGHVAHAAAVAVNPRRWNRKAIWQKAIVDPIACLPAVVVGLLLNILDALSYGKSLHSSFKSISADLRRNDFVPSRKSDLFSFGVSGHLHLLRQHNRFPDHLFLWKHLQGSRRLGTGTCYIPLVAFYPD